MLIYSELHPKSCDYLYLYIIIFTFLTNVSVSYHGSKKLFSFVFISLMHCVVCETVVMYTVNFSGTHCGRNFHSFSCYCLLLPLPPPPLLLPHYHPHHHYYYHYPHYHPHHYHYHPHHYFYYYYCYSYYYFQLCYFIGQRGLLQFKGIT